MEKHLTVIDKPPDKPFTNQKVFKKLKIGAKTKIDLLMEERVCQNDFDFTFLVYYNHLCLSILAIRVAKNQERWWTHWRNYSGIWAHFKSEFLKWLNKILFWWKSADLIDIILFISQGISHIHGDDPFFIKMLSFLIFSQIVVVFLFRVFYPPNPHYCLGRIFMILIYSILSRLLREFKMKFIFFINIYWKFFKVVSQVKLFVIDYPG